MLKRGLFCQLFFFFCSVFDSITHCQEYYQWLERNIILDVVGHKECWLLKNRAKLFYQQVPTTSNVLHSPFIIFGVMALYVY
jgi:hypothetical protein